MFRYNMKYLTLTSLEDPENDMSIILSLMNNVLQKKEEIFKYEKSFYCVDFIW